MLTLGDEIVNINGLRLRGVDLNTARQILSQCSSTAEAVVARTEVMEEVTEVEDMIVIWEEIVTVTSMREGREVERSGEEREGERGGRVRGVVR